MIHTLGLSPSLDVVYTVDAIAAGQIHRPGAVLRLAGGKSLNASRALARLGHRVRAVVPLGGRLGDLVADLLAPTGVQLVRLTSTAATRMCVSATDEDAGTLTEFYEPAPPPDGGELDQLGPALRPIAAGEWLLLSGSVPAGVDLDRLNGLLADCSARGVRVAVDTHGPALGRLLDEAAPTVVEVNRAEAAELAGIDPEEVVGQGETLRRRGAELLVITDGAAGAVGWTADGSWRVRTDAPPGRYPVGSGDCFLAGLVADLAAGRPLPEAMRSAAAVGAANADVPGGPSSIPRQWWPTFSSPQRPGWTDRRIGNGQRQSAKASPAGPWSRCSSRRETSLSHSCGVIDLDGHRGPRQRRGSYGDGRAQTDARRPGSGCLQEEHSAIARWGAVGRSQGPHARYPADVRGSVIARRHWWRHLGATWCRRPSGSSRRHADLQARGARARDYSASAGS